MSADELKNLNLKIYQGLEQSFYKLVDRLAALDGELVVSQNGKVVQIKARSIEKVQRDIK